MSDGTKIPWSDATWPIVNGCRRVSAGCVHCYAERLTATRLRHTPKYAGLSEMVPAAGGVRGALAPRWTGETRLWRGHLDWPLRWRKPRKIFVADMGDLFYEGVSDEDIMEVFNVIGQATWHTFQVLTKRPERMREWMRPLVDFYGAAAFRHVWLGVSVEDQATADARIPVLLDTPAAVRWVSAEPLLEHTWLECYMPPLRPGECDHPWCAAGRHLDWVVVGGESGPGARPFDIAWARQIVRKGREAGVPVFVKQLGANVVVGGNHETAAEADRILKRLRGPKGGDPSEWPEDLRVREFPSGASAPAPQVVRQEAK